MATRVEANQARAKHNHARRGKWTRVYRAWYAMRQRCNNPKTIGWKYYGGKGIRVCERWNTFENFLTDMGEPPTPQHSIDRKKNYLDYTPGNCRWATKHEQDNNRTSNVCVKYGRRTQNIQQWATEIDMSYTTLYRRLVVNKWSIERALTQPVRKTNL